MFTQASQHGLVQLLPDTSGIPVAQTPPASHAAAVAQGLGKVFPWNACLQHEQDRSEEHTSELQSHLNLVCRLLLEKKKHTSALQSHLNLVCRLLLEKKERAHPAPFRPTQGASRRPHLRLPDSVSARYHGSQERILS